MENLNTNKSFKSKAASSVSPDIGHAPDEVGSVDMPGRDLGPSEARTVETPSSRSVGSRVLAALAFGGLVLGAASLGRGSSKRSPWYRTLRKSKATPPGWIFAPVWTGLYSAIAYSGYRTWSQPASPARTRALRYWALQMALNASWTPLFFGKHRPRASAAVATALVPAVAAYVATSRKVDKTAARLMWPYLGWSSFAAYLNAQIVRKNSWRV